MMAAPGPSPGGGVPITYLVQGGRVVLAERGPWDDEDERSAWRISGGEAIHERRYTTGVLSSRS
jgi:hypothetical protein